jgi:type I restriction enzyme R subunit
VVEHFRAYLSPLLEDKAKAQAMVVVVVGGRVEAVRWQLAIEKRESSATLLGMEK